MSCSSQYFNSVSESGSWVRVLERSAIKVDLDHTIGVMLVGMACEHRNDGTQERSFGVD
jgi:hypothetical protein